MVGSSDMAKKMAEVVAQKTVEGLRDLLGGGRSTRMSASDHDVHDAVSDAVADVLREDRAAAVKRVGAVVGTQLSLEGAFVPESRVRALSEALVDAAWGEA